MSLAKNENLQIDEFLLFTEYNKTKDRKLRDEIFSHYQYIAHILSRRFINRGVDYDDIYQVACIGLLNAIERFRPEKSNKFVTFCTPTILGEIRRYFRDKGNFIRLPRRLYEVFYHVEMAKRNAQISGKVLTDRELASFLNTSEDKIKAVHACEQAMFISSLDEQISDDEDFTLSKTIASEDDSFVIIENRNFIINCLRLLDEKERTFIKKRFYREMSQKQIAEEWDVSQMYVSRLEKRLLDKMKQMYLRD